jgi:hypothetical protein
MTDRESISFQERLKRFSEEEHRKAMLLPAGPDRELALRKIRQAQTASNIDNWAGSSGVLPLE